MNVEWSTECESPEATERVGAALGGCVRAGDLIGLIGDLGAGKTLLVRAMAGGLGVPPSVRVTSPTFTIINEYRGGALPLFHADLYRIESVTELEEIGLDEICRRGEGVVAVEWSDRVPALPEDHLEVRIEITGDSSRELRVIGHGLRSRELAGILRGRVG